MKKFAIADSLSYSVFSIDLPMHSSRKNTDSMIREKLAALYPLSLHDKKILVMNNASNRKNKIVMVCEEKFIAENKNRLCAVLLAMKLCKKKTGSCVYIADHFVETIILNKGSFVSRVLISRKENTQNENNDIADCFPENTIMFFSDAQYLHERIIANAEKNTIPLIDVSKLPRSLTQSARIASMLIEYKKKNSACALIVIALCIVSGVFCAQKRIQIIAEAHNAERLQRDAIMKREMEAAQKEILAQTLQSEYSDILQNEMPDMFAVCNTIFASIDAGTKIDNLTITSGAFQFDARGNDAIQILSRFEENNRIEGINLKRIIVDGKEDSFTFSGEVTRHIVQSEDDTVNERIAFYEERLRTFREEQFIMNERRLSEISNIIRQLFLDNQCKLESIQYYNGESGLEIEYAMQGQSIALFTFLRSVSESREHLVISSLRLRTYLEGGTLSAVLRFQTGITFDDESHDSNSILANVEIFSPDELAEYFIVRSFVPPSAIIPVIVPETIIEKVPVRNPSFLHYVGTAKNANGEYFVLIKDTRTNALVKLSEDSAQEHFFVSNNANVLAVQYEGTLYEVQK